MPAAEVDALRWTDMAMVFQSAMNALNPVLSIGEQLTDAVHAHRSVSRDEAEAMAVEMLALVDINADRLRSYPHHVITSYSIHYTKLYDSSGTTRACRRGARTSCSCATRTPISGLSRTSPPRIA